MASRKERRKWSMKVGKVFYTMPRDGSVKDTVWLRRHKVEQRLSDVLGFPGVHICIDGPTGTGKTSLALTELNSEDFEYTLVQVTEKMDWTEFCKRLATPPSDRESSLSAELGVGVEGLVPTGKLEVSLGSTRRPSDSVGLLEEVAKRWSEHDVCQMMTGEKTALLIDDFERASDEILVRVADMSKLLTESYVHPVAKLIIVGTGDIYRRLYQANPSLEARLEEISLGTLPTATDSWKFLQMGFEKLGLTHPANDEHVSREENVQCMQAIYQAADGLPKTLNELGRDISLRGLGRNRISPADVKEIADQIPRKGLSRFRHEFSEIMRLVEKSTAVRILLQQLYETGIGQIHHWSEIVSKEVGELPEDQLATAIQELVEVGFLIQTGPFGDVLYVTDPLVAHTLGVIIENPEKYGQQLEKYAPMGQLTLPFPVEDRRS